MSHNAVVEITEKGHAEPRVTLFLPIPGGLQRPNWRQFVDLELCDIVPACLMRSCWVSIGFEHMEPIP